MSMPAEGTLAPDFTALTDDGRTLRLQDLRGKWVVLYWYPKDATPG
jgi:thioredoxin-dependent peroxiredoxin